MSYRTFAALAFLCLHLPSSSAAGTMWTNTEDVHALAVLPSVGGGRELWAATSGGIERYDHESLERLGVLTREDGLPSHRVYDLVATETGDGHVELRALFEDRVWVARGPEGSWTRLDAPANGSGSRIRRILPGDVLRVAVSDGRVFEALEDGGWRELEESFDSSLLRRSWTLETGAGRLGLDAFGTLDSPDLPPDLLSTPLNRAGAVLVRAALAGEGRVLLGTSSGLWFWQPPGAATDRGLGQASPQLKRLTSDQQICSNHIMAAAARGSELWFASFDRDSPKFVQPYSGATRGAT